MNGIKTNLREQPNGLIENISSFGADLATLAVLQARLAACDVRDEVKRTRLAPCRDVDLCDAQRSRPRRHDHRAAFWLAASYQINVGQAMIVLGMAVLLSASAVFALCVRKLASHGFVFQRSHEELERNLSWITTTLAQSGR